MHLVNRKHSSYLLHAVCKAERPVKAHGVTHNTWPWFLCVPGQMMNGPQWVIYWTAQVHMHAYMYCTRLFFKCCNTHTHTDIIDKTHMLFRNHTTSAESDKLLHCCMACSPFMFTKRCAVPVIQADHIWKHCSPTAGFLRTAWRLACETMQPYEAESSPDQAGVWEWALQLVTLYVSHQTLQKVC